MRLFENGSGHSLSLSSALLRLALILEAVALCSFAVIYAEESSASTSIETRWQTDRTRRRRRATSGSRTRWAGLKT